MSIICCIEHLGSKIHREKKYIQETATTLNGMVAVKLNMLEYQGCHLCNTQRRIWGCYNIQDGTFCDKCFQQHHQKHSEKLGNFLQFPEQQSLQNKTNFKDVHVNTFPARNYSFKVSNRNTRIMSEICSVNDAVLMSLLLTLNRLHTFFWGFHC